MYIFLKNNIYCLIKYVFIIINVLKNDIFPPKKFLIALCSFSLSQIREKELIVTLFPNPFFPNPLK